MFFKVKIEKFVGSNLSHLGTSATVRLIEGVCLIQCPLACNTSFSVLMTYRCYK